MTVFEFLMNVKQIPYWDRTPAISDDELDKLIDSVKPTVKISYRKFPIIQSNPPQSIPWEMLTPHENQAMINHYQSLERLASRGGLSWTEALAVLMDKKWDDSIHDERQAEIIVKKLVEEFMMGDDN